MRRRRLMVWILALALAGSSLARVGESASGSGDVERSEGQVRAQW